MDCDSVVESFPAGEGEPPEVSARRRFLHNRRLANGLLGAMGLIFLVTHFVPDPGFWPLLVRAASEAGLVGGLADWFAVTALFRHPLGVPIPHTAIIPKSKDRIGESLGGFIEQHFLTREVVAGKLRQVGVGQRICAWLARPQSAAKVANTLVLLLPHIVRALGNPDLRDFANRTLGDQLRQADAAPLLARVARALFASGEAEVLFDKGVNLAATLLEDNRPRIEVMVKERSSWWVPRAVDRRISTSIITSLAELLESLRQPDSEARQRFKAAIADYIHALETSPKTQASINASKNRLLDHPDVKAWLGSIWDDLSNLALEDIERSPSSIRSAAERATSLMGQALEKDLAMQSHIDAALERIALRLVSWRGEIGSFFSEVVRNWDTQTLTDRLESFVGSDLQYIRMNGTVVGALVGCLLFLATWWLP